RGVLRLPSTPRHRTCAPRRCRPPSRPAWVRGSLRGSGGAPHQRLRASPVEFGGPRGPPPWPSCSSYSGPVRRKYSSPWSAAEVWTGGGSLATCAPSRERIMSNRARGAHRQRASPRGRSGLLCHLPTVRIATGPRIERVADRLLEFLVALTGRKVLGGRLGTAAYGASANGFDTSVDSLRKERVTDCGRGDRGHRCVLPSRVVTRTEPSKASTARASDSNRPNWVARSFGITVLPASEWQLRDEPGDPPVNQT